MSRSTNRKRHTPQQIIEKLREADALLNAGQSIAHVIQHLGVSEATYHRWRQQFGGMKASEAKRLKELEQENTRLKRRSCWPRRNWTRRFSRKPMTTWETCRPDAYPAGGASCDTSPARDVATSGVQGAWSAAWDAALHAA